MALLQEEKQLVDHHPYRFLLRHKIWYADTQPCGELVVVRFNSQHGLIQAFTVVARTEQRTLEHWEKDDQVILHNFQPHISLDLETPVMELAANSRCIDGDTPPDAGDDASALWYGGEVAETNVKEAFMLCPQETSEDVPNHWPPHIIPASGRVSSIRQSTLPITVQEPKTFAEVSQTHFRLRKWVDRPDARTDPHVLAATIGNNDSLSGDITTYAALLEESYLPTQDKPWQGIWCGGYSGHGAEFVVLIQPDGDDERPLPEGMKQWREWFCGDSEIPASAEESDAGQGKSLRDHESTAPKPETSTDQSSSLSATERGKVYTGRLEAVKLTGDANVPRGEYTFIAPEIGDAGLICVADEAPFEGARVVRCAGQIAGRDFRYAQYTPTQLIMISEDRLAMYWESFGHIVYFHRVDLSALLDLRIPSD